MEKKILLCICEPASVKLYSSKYINQFGNIVSFRNFSRYKGNTISSFPLLPWMVGSKFDFDLKAWDKDNFLDYDTLQQRVTCDKKNKVAVITSNKTLTRGHRQRLDFILKLKSIIPDLLDIYGEGFDFVIDKYDIYSKYKYVLAFENCREKDIGPRRLLMPIYVKLSLFIGELLTYLIIFQKLLMKKLICLLLILPHKK